MPHLTQPATITRLTDTDTAPRAGPTTRSGHMPSHTHNTRTFHPPTSTRPTSGSATQTQTSTPVPPEEHVVLRLRGAHDPSARRRIQWAEDVVDNEGLGRKSSKVCCIYHAPKEVGESSSEEDSSSGDSDSSGGEEDGGARMGKGKKGRKHEHEHADGCEHGAEGGKRPSRNAYERMPKKGGKKVEMVKR